MRVDVNACLGTYPWRAIPGGTVTDLLAVMDRNGIDEAWVGHLDGIFAPDPSLINGELARTLSHHPRLRPVPSIHPGHDGWPQELATASTSRAPAIRADPLRHGVDPVGPEMRRLVTACAAAHLPLLLSVRLEDIRQRDPQDRCPDLEPWAVRALIRSDPTVRLIVTHADREFVEQVHFGSTPAEAARVLWDICWIWGPPEDHLEQLLHTVGGDRFTFGSGAPLRLAEAPVARLDLLDLSESQRHAIDSGNLLHHTSQNPAG